MPRSKVLASQRGSASLLLAVFVLPVMLVLLSIGIEVSGFFGAREEVLEHLDAEMLAGLRTDEPGDAIAATIRGRLRALRPYVAVEDVRVDRRGASIEGRVRGHYRGPLLDLASQLVGVAPQFTSMEVVSFARRPLSAVLLVLDRTVTEGSDPCRDPGLSARAEAIAQSVDRLRKAGVATVRIAVFPGADSDVEVLGDDDSVPRCPVGDSSRENARYVQGAMTGALPSPLGAAVGIVERVMSLSTTAPIEQRAVIIVSKGVGGGAEVMTTTLSLLEQEGARQGVSIHGVGIGVTESEGEGAWTVRSASGRSSYLQVSAADAQAATFVTALVHHTQGRVVIAR
jgi:hypothetical protein